MFNSTIINVVINLFIALFVYYKNPRSKVNLLFSLFALFIAYWDFINFNIEEAETYRFAEFWSHFDSLYFIAGSIFLHFALVFSERMHNVRSKWIYFWIYSPTLLISLIDLFTNYFTWIPIVNPDGSFKIGPSNNLNYIGDLVSASLGIIGIAICVQFYLYTKEKYKKTQSRLIFVAFIIPIVGNLLVLMEPWGFVIPDIPITGLTIAIIIIGYAVWKYELFLINPVTAAESIVSTMNDALIILNPDRKIVSTNISTLNISGHEKYELIDQDISILFSNNFNYDIFTKLNEGGEVSDEETNLLTKNGKLVPISLSCTTIKHNNILQGFVCIVRDITERKRNQELTEVYNQQLIRTKAEIEEAKERTDSILLAVGEGMIVTDKDGNISLVNKVFEDLLGWKSFEVVGKKLTEIVEMQDQQGNKIPDSVRLKPLLEFTNKKITALKQTYTATMTNHFFITKDKNKVLVTVITSPIYFRWEVIGLVQTFHIV